MIKYLKDNNFEEEIKEGLVLVDFFATWCGPCRQLGTILETITDVNILKVDTDEFNELALSFGIMSIPTVILFKDGKEVNKFVGLRSREEILNFIKDNNK